MLFRLLDTCPPHAPRPLTQPPAPAAAWRHLGSSCGGPGGSARRGLSPRATRARRSRGAPPATNAAELLSKAGREAGPRTRAKGRYGRPGTRRDGECARVVSRGGARKARLRPRVADVEACPAVESVRVRLGQRAEHGSIEQLAVERLGGRR